MIINQELVSNENFEIYNEEIDSEYSIQSRAFLSIRVKWNKLEISTNSAGAKTIGILFVLAALGGDILVMLSGMKSAANSLSGDKLFKKLNEIFYLTLGGVFSKFIGAVGDVFGKALEAFSFIMLIFNVLASSSGIGMIVTIFKFILAFAWGIISSFLHNAGIEMAKEGFRGFGAWVNVKVKWSWRKGIYIKYYVI